jgi:hypothetical protein
MKTDSPVPAEVALSPPSVSVTRTAGRRRPWTTTVRTVAYWYLWYFLVFDLVVSVWDVLGYHDDPAGYHQVYRDPALQQATCWISGFLDAIAIACQIAGWRTRRFSLFAVADFGLSVCFGVADSQFDIIQICCG